LNPPVDVFADDAPKLPTDQSESVESSGLVQSFVPKPTEDQQFGGSFSSGLPACVLLISDRPQSSRHYNGTQLLGARIGRS